MAKNLKLVGLKTYAGPAVRGTVIKKGETVRFSEEVSLELLKGGTQKDEDEFAPYWKECDDKTKLDWDFTAYVLTQQAGRPQRLTEEPKGDEEAEGDTQEEAPASRQRVSRARPSATA